MRRWLRVKDSKWADDPNLIDLGDDHSYRKVYFEGKFYGIDQRHKSKKNGSTCEGWIPLHGDSPNSWELVTEEPLTISPSLLCHCGDHGFIRNGRWEAV
jgi:hypothetical protein